MHVSWDPDLPERFLEANERHIKFCVRRFLEGSGPLFFSVTLHDLVLRVRRTIEPPSLPKTVWLQVTPQANIRTGDRRCLVHPRCREDAKLIRDWDRREREAEEELYGRGR